MDGIKKGVKLGTDWACVRRSKGSTFCATAGGCPVQTPTLQPAPAPKVAAEMLWGGFCVSLPQNKIMGTWEGLCCTSHQTSRRELRKLQVLPPADLGRLIHGKVCFPQALTLLPVLAGLTLWWIYKLRLPPGINRQLAWQLYANKCWETAFLAQLFKQATDPAVLFNVHLMWTSPRKGGHLQSLISLISAAETWRHDIAGISS